MFKKLKDWINSDKRPFATGMGFKKLFLIFVFGSFLGVLHENIWGVIKRLWWYKKFIWTDHQGVIYGPFNPLYGFGIVLIIYFLGKKKRHFFKTFLYGAIWGGFFEYVVSYFMELLLGAKSWDYSTYFLNINGRTTIPYMLFWGLGIALLVHYIYPILSKWVEKIPKKIGDILVVGLLIFMIFDITVSWTAVIRQSLRRKGYPPISVIGELCDKFYPDEVLKKTYRNMSFVE